MKNGNRFRFAFYSFAQRKSTFFLASLLMAVSLVLCGMSKMYYEIVEYNESSTDKVLKNGISKTGVLDIDLDWDNNTADAYRMKLIETGLFEAIGSMELCTLFAENLEELLEIQNKGEVINEELNAEEEVEMLLLDCTLFELCDLELFAGEKMNEDASKKVNDTYSVSDE